MKIGISLTSSIEVDNKYISLTGRLASTLAANGYGIVYGGTDYGMMRKLAESYKNDNGKPLCGVIANDLVRTTINYKKFEELDKEYLVNTIEERKKKILELSDAILILPGGYGTFEEIATFIGGKANKLHSKPIAFYNYDHFYDKLLEFLETLYIEKFSKNSPNLLYLASDNIEYILSYFKNYSSTELKDKFI